MNSGLLKMYYLKKKNISFIEIILELQLSFFFLSSHF